MRFEELYQLRAEGKLTIEQAAHLLGVHERTFRRWTHRYEADPAGLVDRRLDKAAHNAAPVDEVAKMLRLFETKYTNFTVAHFYDKYRYEHGGSRCYSWVKNCLQEAGLVKKAKKRGTHRRKRLPVPMKGMMLHQDGSTHQWIKEKYWDLIVTLDDADNEIYSGFFVEEEGTWSSFKGVKEVILKHGLFCSLYVDRGSHYFHTSEQGSKVDRHHPTQFARAMNQLGIDLIAAYSPEARGRSERMFRTFQGRLPQELKLAGITDMQQANHFLREKFIPELNQRFQRQPQEKTSAFVPWIDASMRLEDILCMQQNRIVNKDNTVRYNNLILQLPKDKYRYSYHKAKVRVNEYENGSLGLFHGPRCLAHYQADACLIPSQSVDAMKGKEVAYA